MLTWEYPPKQVGGIASHVVDLGCELCRQGMDVTVVTCGDSGLPEYELDGDIKVYRVIPYPIHTYHITQWAYNLNLAMLEKCIVLIRENGIFDIIHAHDWMVAFAARLLKSVYTIPLVATIHATEYGRNNGLYDDNQRYLSDIEWWLTYESWKVICCSYYMENHLRSFFQLPEDKVHVIYNGVDPARFISPTPNRDFRAQYATDSEKIVFFIGRLVHEKGIITLIEAIPIVLQQLHHVKFIIAGKGPDSDFLKQRAFQLGIASQVYFTGYIDDKTRNQLYQISDIAVFPSFYEPFGIVAIEGMAACVPIIVSDIGGLREIVNHDVDGLKFQVGNAAELAYHMIDLLNNPEKRRQFSAKAFQKIQQQFGWKLICAKTRAVYESAIKHKNSKGMI